MFHQPMTENQIRVAQYWLWHFEEQQKRFRQRYGASAPAFETGFDPHVMTEAERVIYGANQRIIATLEAELTAAHALPDGFDDDGNPIYVQGHWTPPALLAREDDV